MALSKRLHCSLSFFWSRPTTSVFQSNMCILPHLHQTLPVAAWATSGLRRDCCVSFVVFRSFSVPSMGQLSPTRWHKANGKEQNTPGCLRSAALRPALSFVSYGEFVSYFRLEQQSRVWPSVELPSVHLQNELNAKTRREMPEKGSSVMHDVRMLHPSFVFDAP